MSIEWYRVYHNMPNDPKLKVIAKRTEQPMAFVVAVWMSVMDAASQHGPRGIFETDPEQVAVMLEISLDGVESILQAFHDKRMLDDHGHLTNWDKRQHTTSTERSQKSRAAKQQDATFGDAMQRGETFRSSVGRKKGKNHPDTDTDTEKETDTDQITDNKYTNKKTKREKKGECEREKYAACDEATLQRMVDVWNEEVQIKMTPDHKAILTDKRRKLLAARWIENFHEDIRAWRFYCSIIANSKFCLGSKGWTMNLTRAIQSTDRVANVLEGAYSDGNHPPKPPACDVAEFQATWDDVIRRMTHHYGKSVMRSWFTRTVVTSADEQTITLACPNQFICGWIERNYLTDLLSYLADHQPRITHINFTVKED